MSSEALATLYIAEKREVAAAIAEAFNGKQTAANSGAYYTPKGVITWLSGHLLELANPDQHDPKYKKWQLDHLPLVWPVEHYPIQRGKNHLSFVVKLIGQASQLVNAGDPDPEGQRLVDEVIEYAGATHLPCKRLLVNDNNPDAIRQAARNMKDNAQFRGLSLSALARAVCDQRYGVNLTRLFTLIAKRQGNDTLLSVGRVQTPILGMVVNRDHAHESHTATHYYTLHASTTLKGVPVSVQYQPVNTDPCDDDNRLNDQAHANALALACEQRPGIVRSLETKDKARTAPLPYNLLALQAEAAQRWGYKPKDVLAITQTLRDQHRAITYNRSDCRYLNDERHADATAVIEALTAQYGLMATTAKPSLKSKAFNSNKVTAHHAIIPTLRVPDLDKLTAAERNIYDLIARLYLAQFYPPETYRSTTLILGIVDDAGVEHRFKGSARVDVSRGWLDLYDTTPQDEKAGDEAPRNNWEALQVGDEGVVEACICKAEKTKPLPRYTLSTLLQDLSRVAKYVKDPKIRKLLLDKDADKQDEAGGIGTPATRDTMIDMLFQRGFVIEQGKAVVSTDLGRQFIASLPDFAVNPDLTALWHEQQQQIEAGKLDWQELVAQVDAVIAEEVRRMKDGGTLGIASGEICPTCGVGHLQRRKGKNGFFWGCSCYPECKATLPDNKGKPQREPATKGSNKKSAAKPDEKHACPVCNAALIRRASTKQPGSYWWGCSEWKEGCKFTAPDNNGKPQTTGNAR